MRRSDMKLSTRIVVLASVVFTAIFVPLKEARAGAYNCCGSDSGCNVLNRSLHCNPGSCTDGYPVCCANLCNS
jgi:hypothetical protein